MGFFCFKIPFEDDFIFVLLDRDWLIESLS
jgi:hypothetical protein